MLEIGALIYGFCVKSVTDLPDVEGRMWRMTYEKNGAELVWLERKDDVLLQNVVSFGVKDYMIGRTWMSFRARVKGYVMSYLYSSKFLEFLNYPANDSCMVFGFDTLQVHVDSTHRFIENLISTIRWIVYVSDQLFNGFVLTMTRWSVFGVTMLDMHSLELVILWLSCRDVEFGIVKRGDVKLVLVLDSSGFSYGDFHVGWFGNESS